VATRGSELSEPGGNHYVDEGFVSFGSGPDARKFLATFTGRLALLRRQTRHLHPKDGKPNTWTIRTPVTTDGIIAAVVDEEGGDGYACLHGITAKSNVVIDVSACSHGIADQGATVVNIIVNAIAGKFPT
jgi:PknH-like extracellular domain